MKDELVRDISAAAMVAGIEGAQPQLEYPDNVDHGDFSTNIAMAHAKKLGMKPRDLAEKIVAELQKDMPVFIESIEIAGAGFINFKIKDRVFVELILPIGGPENKLAKPGSDAGAQQGVPAKAKKIMVEYTDPNPFKVFHIGHLMSNAIGESISRLIQANGAQVIRACYQGDVGLHVAKTIWAVQRQGSGMKDQESKSIKEKVKWLGEMYAVGEEAFAKDEVTQKEIAVTNKKIFEKSDPEINSMYEKGRDWSLEYFDEIYKRLDTSFDKFFYESEVADLGMKIVKEFLGKGVFVESEGAIIFKGEDHGTHTRVFITSNGLPTYETKELGLNTEKFKQYPDLDESIIITANEQNDYFKVLLKAFSLVNPPIAEKTKHMSHGMLRFASGKMSSRKGNVIAAETLIDDIRALVKEKMSDRKLDPAEVDEVTDMVAIGAIKYTILRQAIGGDVIFDSAASISFEGDSGPYLQYSAARANSILDKARGEEITIGWQDGNTMALPDKVGLLERLIVRYPDVIERARHEYAPQHVASYLITLAGAFNSFYAAQVILDKNDPLSPYRLALTRAFASVMWKGLGVLGIGTPMRM